MRYYIVKEFFGIRVFDSVEKTETYFDCANEEKVKKLLVNDYVYIDNFKGEKKITAPFKISMNLTKKCNLRCKQCFSDSGEMRAVELTTQEMYKLFDDMREYGTNFICLGGGEPLTRPDLLDILEYGKKKQLAISVVSNGLLLTSELIQKLNQLDLDTFWISLDGLKDNHENLRGKGTFDKTIEKINMLGREFKSKTAIRMSLNKHNINEYKGIIKIAEENNIGLVRFTPILSFGRAKNEDLTITQEQYIEFLNEIRNIKAKCKIVYPNMPSDRFWAGENGFGCHCGKEAMWIDEVGNYSPCIFYGDEYTVGNIKTDDYIELWHKAMDVSAFEGNEVCKNCANFKNCRGGCRARVNFDLGNFNDVDPLCPLRKNKK